MRPACGQVHSLRNLLWLIKLCKVMACFDVLLKYLAVESEKTACLNFDTVHSFCNCQRFQVRLRN
jgi:hypothetical protein